MKAIAALIAPLAAGLMLAAAVPAETGAAGGAAGHAAETAATTKIADAFLTRYFVSHDMTTYQDFADPDFIQHDPEMGNGLAGYRAFFAKLAGMPKPAGPPMPPKNITDMVLVDGDLFAVMHHSVAPGDHDRLFVDIWRVKDGKIAEHWDVIQPIPATMPNPNGMACGDIYSYAKAQTYTDSISHPTCGLPDPKASRAASLATYRAYTAEVGKGEVIPAINRWFAADYRQHSPTIADGKQGAIDYLRKEWGDQSRAKPVLGPQRIVAQGDLVLVHYMLTDPQTKRQEAHVDIFRITNGKISEHWDIKQPVPTKTVSGNAMW